MKIIFSIIVIIIIFFLIKDSKKVRDEQGFTTANRGLSYSGVAFVIVGTLVGGASTVGTVQLAYSYGIAAWIFTLFSGAACLILGLFFASALREEEVITVSEFIGSRFGKAIQKQTSLFASFGMYIHITAQFLAAMSIIETVFSIGSIPSMILAFILIFIFVAAGGVSSSKVLGNIKIYLLYILMTSCALLAVYKQNGIANIINSLPKGDWLNLFAYGKIEASKDMVAMVIGVLSTQTYLQAIFSAKDVKTAKKGAFLSAALIPPIGLLGIVVGMFMRIHHPEIINNTKIAFPYFIKLYFNPAAAAVSMSALIVIIIGTAAGLTLGVTTNMYIDIIKNSPFDTTKIGSVSKMRIIAFVVLFSSLAFVLTGLDSAILSWSYMSMSIRGVSIFMPLLAIILIKDQKILTKLKPAVILIPVLYILMSIIIKFA